MPRKNREVELPERYRRVEDVEAVDPPVLVLTFEDEPLFTFEDEPLYLF